MEIGIAIIAVALVVCMGTALIGVLTDE